MPEFNEKQISYYQNIEKAVKEQNNADFIRNLVDLEKTGEIIKNIKSPDGLNLLQYIFQEGFVNEATIKWLLDKGLNPNDNIKDVPILLYCIGEEEIAAAKLLIKYGADINCHNKSKHTPLMWAIESGDKELFYMCLNNKADIYFEDKKGDNALIWAIRNMRLEAVKILTQGYLRDYDTEKALTEAAINSSAEILDYLLEIARPSYFSSPSFLKKLQEIASKNDNDEIVTCIGNKLRELGISSLKLECDSSEGEGLDFEFSTSPPPLAIMDGPLEIAPPPLIGWED